MADSSLQWFQVMVGQGSWNADTAFGLYSVWEARGTCWMHPPGAHSGMPGSPDIAAAKAIAEAHYAEALRVRDGYEAQPETRR